MIKELRIYVVLAAVLLGGSLTTSAAYQPVEHRKLKPGENRKTTTVVNFIENAGFEQEGTGGIPEGWVLSPDHAKRGKAVMDDEKAHTGKYSLMLKPGWSNTSDGFGVLMTLDSDKIRGKDVTISGYAMHEGLGKNTAAIMFKTNKMNWLVIPKNTENKFIPFSKSFSVPDSGLDDTSLIFLLVGGKNGAIWFDDLSLTVGKNEQTKQVGAFENTAPTTSDDKYVERINTPGWQDSIFISPDGKELYFGYIRYGQRDLADVVVGNVSAKDVKIKGPVRPGSHGNMYFETYRTTKNKDGTWQKPVNININGNYHLYAAKLSFDGNELYYVLKDHPGDLGAGDIYVSQKQPDGKWSAPRNLGPSINTVNNEDTPFINSDGKSLYFARNIGDALGFEIMVSHRVKGKWTKAEKVPYPINEPDSKKTANHQPFITADGKEFYFTRIQQLYKSEKHSDGSWGKPFCVFPDIPISGHASATADGKYLYFMGAKEKEDIDRSHWILWYSKRQKDGSWGEPIPVD